MNATATATRYNWGTQKQHLRVIGEPTADLLGTLQEWEMWQQAGNLSQRTIRERRGTITHLFEHAGCGPLELEPRHIIAFLTRPGLADSSRASYHATIRAYCQWLLKSGKRDDDPTLRTPKTKRRKGVPRPVTESQLEAMLNIVARRRTRMMILLAAFGGLRVHEIAKLRGEDLDYEGRYIYVTGKGAKPAVVPLHSRIEELAKEFPKTGYWFPAYDRPGPVDPHAVTKAISQCMARAGFVGTSHQLRHYFGTMLCRNGVDLRTVQELMRHESLATTAIYTQVSDKQRRAGIDSLQ